MHEIGHLILHDLEPHIEYIDGEKECEIDKEANKFASDFFIKPDLYELFLEKGSFTRQTIEVFAADNNILPGIVVGRLQHDGYIQKNEFNYLKTSFR
jgi:Zn-dependent peptidase ImmA (M78 family)